MPLVGGDNPGSSSGADAAGPTAAAADSGPGQYIDRQPVYANYYYPSFHQQQQQQHLHHHHQQQYRQEQPAFSYSPPGLGSPPLGFISGSPPGHLSPSPQAAATPLGVAAGGFALVNGQVLGGSPPQYAYYAVGGSPVGGGSPQMTPLVPGGSGSPVNTGMGHFMPLPIAQAGAGRAEDAPHLVSSPPTRMGTVPADVHDSAAEAVDSRNVYIRNLPESCTDEVLARMAAPYGEIESSKSIIHETTGKCKGYGFVKYQTEEQAQKAIESFSAKGLHSTLARDSFKSKLKRLQDRNSTNVYISNLSPEIDEVALIELIKPHTVVSARILRDPLTGYHKGAGFARMTDRETALVVIEKLRGIRLPNSSGPLIPRIADSESQKQLKKQVNGGRGATAGAPVAVAGHHSSHSGEFVVNGGRLDEAMYRSNTTSPLMWSPVLVYSPTASPPLPPLIQSTDESRQIPSPHYRPEQRFGAQQGMYPLPAHHYPGYASPPLGLATVGSYTSSAGGYMSPTSPPPQPAAYAHMPDQPHVPRAAPAQRRRSQRRSAAGQPPSKPADHAVDELAGTIQDKLSV
ncbi:hypothetical protein GGF46_005002 [Coemansia sp. RSA 552]|nr:hypothetical protein GGF46_005002 [Coemansia sp. RSA 552]